jgi:hypothetical protein
VKNEGGNEVNKGQQGQGGQTAGQRSTATTTTFDKTKLRELVAKMARLKLVREELTIPKAGAGAGIRPSLIVQMVARYNTLAGEHLRRLCYFHLTPGSALKCYYRETKRLVDEGFIAREWRSDRGDNVYWLGQWGRALETINGRRLRGDRRLLWGHDLLVADFMTWAMVGARRSGGMAEWLGEYEARLAPEPRPDATGIISTSGRELHYWLEADTGTEAENVFAEKYDKYHRYHRSIAGAGAGNVVLVVTKGKQERLARMIACLGERRQQLGAGVSWLLTTEELMGQVDNQASSGPAFERIWYDLEAQSRRAVWRP